MVTKRSWGDRPPSDSGRGSTHAISRSSRLTPMMPKRDNKPVDGARLPDSASNPAGHELWPVSTTWRSPQGTVSRAPQATGTAAARGVRLAQLPRRNPRDPLTVTVRYRGGPEGWVELRTRGATVRVPGHTDVASLVLLLNSQVS